MLFHESLIEEHIGSTLDLIHNAELFSVVALVPIFSECPRESNLNFSSNCALFSIVCGYGSSVIRWLQFKGFYDGTRDKIVSFIAGVKQHISRHRWTIIHLFVNPDHLRIRR
jgi:hypothetical protein